MKQKPLILITNDDGYQAKGIGSLTKFLIGMGEIVVVAPDGARSGMSGAISAEQVIRYKQIEENKDQDLKIYSCTGTPVDCVKLAIGEILDRTPDLVVSGINHGSNASCNVLYSGTMGAAIEACISDIPAIGFSLLDHHPDADFSGAEKFVQSLSQEILETGLPKGVCLNVNIPKGNPLGMKVCRQSAGQWGEEFVRSKDGSNRDVFWLTGKFENKDPEARDTDEWYLSQNFLSIVPTKIDMTAHEAIDTLQSLEKL